MSLNKDYTQRFELTTEFVNADSCHIKLLKKTNFGPQPLLGAF